MKILIYLPFMAAAWPCSSARSTTCEIGRGCDGGTGGGRNYRLAHGYANRGTLYVSEVRFSTPDGRAITFVSRPGRTAPPVVGSTVSVLYDPKDPARAQLNDNTFQHAPLVCLICAVVFSIGGLPVVCAERQMSTRQYPNFVTHLECSLTGERYEAGIVHGLSTAGRPLLVRYDLNALSRAVSKEDIARRGGGFWKWREFLPVKHSENVVALGEVDTPLDQAAARCAQDSRGAGQGRRPPADRLVQGARPGAGGGDGQGTRPQASGHADQRQCRGGDGGLWRGGRLALDRVLSRRHARRSTSRRSRRRAPRCSRSTG